MKEVILVTGGTGYIGSHTTVELIDKGFDVLIVDNLSNSEDFVIDKIVEITGKRPYFERFDLCNLQKTKDIFNKYKINAIVHFAAYKAVGESVEQPLKYYQNNLISLMNILQCMQEFNVENIVFSSSCTVYGEPDSLPVSENAEIKKANSPYGNTKQISEEIIHDTIRANQNLKAISLRYFNPIGAHKSALIGELPKGVPNNLVPFITQTAIGIREQLSVFGSDYNTPDGTCIRDYINVVDLAKAHVLAINRLLENKSKDKYEYFNVGTGNGNSVLEIIKTFEKATGVKLNYKITDRRAGDVESVYAETKKSNTYLGWKADSTLEETLLSAWKWEQYIRKNQ
jgi:UDP-glucose 4-epimerase